MKQTTTTTTQTEPTGMAKTFKVIGTVILVSGLGYLLYNLLKRRPTTIKGIASDLGQTVKNAPQEIKSAISGKYIDCGFPLRKGCGGVNVKKVQKWLNREGNYGLVEDGKFGDLTENAIIDNQMPFETFKSMHPYAIKGQISEEFFNTFLKNE